MKKTAESYWKSGRKMKKNTALLLSVLSLIAGIAIGFLYASVRMSNRFCNPHNTWHGPDEEDFMDEDEDIYGC